MVNGTEVEFPVGDGVLSGLDFGGQGEGVLLVHGSGHNAAAWTDVASRLVAHCHPVAVDLRGHGQTAIDSSGPEQYWRDLSSVVAALSWDRPVLVGHSTGGYAVTAATASGLVKPAMLCVVDGVVLDDRATSATSHAAMRTPEAADQLRAMFRYGWRADNEQMHAYRAVRARGRNRLAQCRSTTRARPTGRATLFPSPRWLVGTPPDHQRDCHRRWPGPQQGDLSERRPVRPHHVSAHDRAGRRRFLCPAPCHEAVCISR